MATGGGGSRPISLSSESFYDFPCTVCAKDEKFTEGERFCVECNETFCASCLMFHNKIATMRQHELLDMLTRKSRIEAMQLHVAKKSNEVQEEQLPTSECTVHKGQIINMYCGQDDVVCCHICIAENHRNCEGVNYIPLKAKNIKTSQEFQDVNAAIDTMREDIEMLKKGKSLDLERITAQHAEIQASLGKLRIQINNHLDHLEASINDELIRKFKINEKEINEMIAKLDSKLLEMEKRAGNMKYDLNESQVFVEMKVTKLKHEEGRKLIENADKYIGKAAIHYVPNKEISKILEIKSFGILNDQKLFSSVSHYGDFNVKTQEDEKNCKIPGSCKMLDGNIVMTDLFNKKLKLLDRSYKVIAECKLPGDPWNVCRISPTEIAIALGINTKVLFAEVTGKIFLKGSFSVGEVCRGIAYNEGLLYVTCGGRKVKNEGPGQVRVYDMAGKLLQTFMKDKHKKKVFSMPTAIVVSECRTLLHIVDLDNGIVTMKLDGTEPWKFTNLSMKSPTGICVVNNDDLIVCGGSSKNVILFDKKGQQKAILLNENDGIKYPNSVLYDRPNSRLIVSLCDLNHIKVYNLV